MEVPEQLIDVVIKILLRQVGDTRECPHCRDAFIPQDKTSDEAYYAYESLKQLREE